MISQREIERLSEELGVLKNTVDKDWVLGHFMDAIYSVKKLKEKLIFKGGTCLKKCYFPDYRFSEDLDFTATDENFVFTNELLKKITDHVTKKSGVACHVVSLRDLIYKNRKTGYEAIVKYWGADHAKNIAPPPPERWLTSIKIEIILYEIMPFPSENKDLFHSYSDKLTNHSKNIPCYAIEEVISEKTRALIQRKYTAPRDYYDIWYLSRNYPKLNAKNIVRAFHEKMKYKELEFTGVEQLINEDHVQILEKNWKHSLGHQIPKGKLPSCETVVSDVRKYLNKIFE